MPQLVDRAGTFRGEIVEYGMLQAESGATAVKIFARLDEYWDEDQWVDWKKYEMQAHGNLWIIKKDGSRNQRQVEALCRHAGWDGDPYFAQGRWEPSPCQFTITEEPPNDYHEDTRYSIAWLNAWERTPGAQGNMSEDALKALANQHGAALRAIAGNVRRNAPAPEGKPPAPPKTPAAITPEEARAAGAEGGDGIPF